MPAYLVGRDAHAIEHHWNVMHRDAHYQGAAINGAISAIDVALWDIKGKALGVPVHVLLGGPYRTKARVYGHAYGPTQKAVVQACRDLKAHGFTAIGHLNPFLDEGEDTIYFQTHSQKITTAAERVGEYRDAVGADVDLLIELHRRLSVAEAVQFARAVEPWRPMWLEDPIRPEPIDAMAGVAQQSPIPIATGERFVGLHQFHMLLARGGASFSRTSIGLCGGITGARKIAAIAEGHGVELAPHCPFSPVTLAAGLQIAAAVPNFAIQEFTTGFDNMRMKSGTTLLGADIVDPVPVLEDGFAIVPDAPGIGVSLMADAATIRPPVTRTIGMRPHADGSVVEQ